MVKMQEHIKQNNVESWAADFLNSLQEIIEHIEAEI
jgi:hypothetical protein